MSMKAKLEAEYPNENWAHVDGGKDGEQPVFWYSNGVYGIHSDMWPSGLTEMTSNEIRLFLLN